MSDLSGNEPVSQRTRHKASNFRRTMSENNITENIPITLEEFHQTEQSLDLPIPLSPVVLVNNQQESPTQQGLIELLSSDDVNPIDSVSQVSSKGSTHSSNISKLRLKQEQKRVELETLQKKLVTKQKLQKQKLELQCMEEQLELETAIEIAEAQAKVLSESEGTSSIAVSNSDVKMPNSVNETWNKEVISKDVPHRQHLEPVPFSDIDAHTLIQNIKRPPTELKKFGGDPLEYHKFMRQFNTKVLLYTTNDDERMNYLEQYTMGQPNKIVSGYSYLDAQLGYSAAMKELAERYGNPEIIAKAICNKALEWKDIGVNNPTSLDEYGIFLAECYNAIQTIDALKIMEYPHVMAELVRKLPFYLHDRWSTRVYQRQKAKQSVNFMLLVEFVKEEAKKCTDPIYGKDAMKTPFIPNNQSRLKPKASFLTQVSNQPETTEPKMKCVSCGDFHKLEECDNLKRKPHYEKLNILRQNGICFGCLEKGHMRSQCQQRKKCMKCEFNHPTILHIEPLEYSSPRKDETSMKACALTRAGNKSDCTMAIVPVKVRSRNGLHLINTHAFLDPGSSVTFCSNRLMKKLGIEGKRTKITLDTMTSSSTITSYIIEGLEVFECNLNDSIKIPRCYTKDRIPVDNEHIPTKEDIQKWPHLNTLSLNEMDDNCGIDLMIGNNIPDAYTPLEIATGPRGSPHATRTAIGWVLWNVLRETNNSLENETVNRVEILKVEDYDRLNELDNLLRDTIKYDFPERTIDDKSELSNSDKLFCQKVEKSIKHIDGKYEIRLPFRDDNIKLPDNQILVMNRLHGLKRKMNLNPNFKTDYTEFMNSIIQDGYAEEIPLQEIDIQYDKKWYIPHHGVYHKQKKKIRAVFDCSAKCNGLALNDVLLPGPDLANNLLGVLMRFRIGKIGMISDIKSMFHQIKIPAKDRDSLRFLWWPQGNTKTEPKQFRMTSHLFGAVSSPSIANYALQQTARDFADRFTPDVVKTILENFYVDDCLRSMDNEQEAIILVEKLIELCKLGGFRLNKWITNSTAVLESIPTSERAPVKTTSLGENDSIVERALGVNWDVASDTLTFKINPKDQPFTRRGLLSIISSVFDPLGLVCPALLYPKTLLQELCQKGISWDHPIDENQHRKWSQWLQELPNLENLHLPRCVKPKKFETIISSELHTFSDASLLGYGICSYLRLMDSTGLVTCTLILGKSRVVPIKKITIPRLELTAATVAVKLTRKIITELKIELDKIYYWTDSTTVLGYIANESTRFQTFVANRVSLIREATTIDQWRKVSSEDNPSDDASRGLTINELINRKRWFRGPEFLYQPAGMWPSEHTPGMLSETDLEIKKINAVVINPEPFDVFEKLLNFYSNWNKLRKAVAWLLCVKQILLSKVRKDQKAKRDGKKTVLLESKDFEYGETCLIKNEQSKYLCGTLTACLNNDQNQNKKKLKENGTSKLDPFVDTNGILRVGGRLVKSDIEFDSKHQIILPKDSRLSEIIIRQTHSSVGHMGKNTILAELRKKYWIIGANKIIKSIISTCVICRRNSAKVNQQKMADLPTNRITASEMPFTFTGMDFFGPFEIKQRRSIIKRYGVIFSCFNSRAVHLEMASSMDTDSCINCIRRFIARRGVPKTIRSDNGTNIVGAVNELKHCLNELNQRKLNDELTQRGIKWEFNPPAASNFGGVWERMIRSVRKVLNSLLHEQMNKLDDESLCTLFCEVEYILNCRPLTKHSEEPDDFDAITPNHLLLVGNRNNLSPVITNKSDLYVRRRWRQVQYLSDIFWKRWTLEYLPCLQERHKWLYPTKSVAVNDIVLILDSSVRNSWTLARVLEIFPDTNGVVRVVRLKTKCSTLERPVNKLCVLLEADQ